METPSKESPSKKIQPMATETKRNTAVVVGASSGVGRALAVRLAEAGYDLVISAREARDLEATAADLELRLGRRVAPLPLDLAAADFDPAVYHRRCVEELGHVGVVVVTAGAIHDGDDGSLGGAAVERLARVNFTSQVELLTPFLDEFRARDEGTAVLFSSIAAAAPRGRNMVYGASKAALEYYGRALRHSLKNTGAVVQIYGLGYVDTAMSFGQDLKLPVADPADVAEHVVRHLGRDVGLVYYPRFWRWVTLVLRHLPWTLYRRLDF